MIFKVRKSFSCAHFYKQPQWSEDRNRSEFGKCFTDYGHGHDYTLEIEFECSDPQSALPTIGEIVEKLDHQHLNFVIPEFSRKIPTTENLALYIFDETLKKWNSLNPAPRLKNLRLFETPEIWVELPGPV